MSAPASHTGTSRPSAFQGRKREPSTPTAHVEILIPFRILQANQAGPLTLHRGTGCLVPDSHPRLRPYPGGLPFLEQELGDGLLERLRIIPGSKPTAYSLELESEICLEGVASVPPDLFPVLDYGARKPAALTGCPLPPHRPARQEEAMEIYGYRAAWALDMRRVYPNFAPLP